MSRSRPTAGKRQRQQQKREKAQIKVERRAARQAMEPESIETPVEASESQLIDELAGLHHSFEAGELEHDDFENRREQIRRQLEQVQGRQAGQ